MKRARKLAIGSLALISSLSALGQASNQPYIEALKQGLREEDAEEEKPAQEESYSQSLKKKLKQEESGQRQNESYIDYLKRTDPKNGDQEATQPSRRSFTEEEKDRLGAPNNGGAIEAYRQGKSDLVAKREGEINHAAGLRYLVSPQRAISGGESVQQRGFSEVYGTNYAPEFSFFYEYQPFHSEWYGNIGLNFSLGFGYFTGRGTFEKELPNVLTGSGNFARESKTDFRFLTIPFTVALDYRFNLFRVVRPFVLAGPTLMGFIEGRSDDVGSKYGYSKCLTLTGGASILLDWMSSDSANDLYAHYGVKHYYLTIEYSKLTTLSGGVDFASSGINAGLTFEF